MIYSWLNECLDSVTGQDLEAVNSLLKRLSPNSPRLSPEDLKRLSLTPGTHIILVKDPTAGLIVGMARLSEVLMLVGSEGVIADVVVNESYGGQGIGKALLQHLIRRASQIGLRRLFLVCWPKNETANHLYRSLGFEQLEVNYYRLKL